MEKVMSDFEKSVHEDIVQWANSRWGDAWDEWSMVWVAKAYWAERGLTQDNTVEG